MQNIPDICRVSQALLSQLKQRFAKWAHSTTPDHSPMYLVATMLDPRYGTSDQMASAKAHMIKSLKKNGEDSPVNSQSDNEKVSADVNEEPPTKCFHYLSKLIEEKVKVTKTKKSAYQQLERYLEDVPKTHQHVDNILWQIDHSSKLGTSCNRLFDYTIYLYSECSLQLAYVQVEGITVNLEQEVLLHKNRKYLNM